MDVPSLDRLRVLFEMQRQNRCRVARSTAPERVAKLRHLKRAILEHREALSSAMHADFGKAPFEVDLTEIHMVIAEINFAVARLEGWMRPQRVPAPPKMLGTRSEVRLEPRGVVLILGPWNYPFNLLFAPLIGAIAAGNCVMLRPSEKVPHTAGVMRALIEATFDSSEVALVTGEVQTAEALLELPFDHIFFTGSTAVGGKVMAAAARHLSSVTLELGGKSPALLLEDADLDTAARRILYGKLVNAGQTCVAPDYVLLPRRLEGVFLERLRHHMVGMYGSLEVSQDNPDLARIVDVAGVQRLERLIEGSVAQGARLELGGHTDVSTRFVAPTVLSGVTPTMPIMAEEIFGPVLPLLAYDTLTEALEFVASRPKPLALYAFGQDHAVLEHVLTHTRAGGTVFNHVFFNMLNPNLPFGGVGESGLGGSYHGFYGFRTFSHERGVLHQGAGGLSGMFLPPYTTALKKLAQRALRLLE